MAPRVQEDHHGPSQAYWSRSHAVDYRSHHLRRPPRGYQWVRVDISYALIALVSGPISDIIAQR